MSLTFVEWDQKVGEKKIKKTEVMNKFIKGDQRKIKIV